MRLITCLFLTFFGLVCISCQSTFDNSANGPSNAVTGDVLPGSLQNSHVFQSVNMSLIPVEEQDAMVVEYLLVQSFKSVRISIRVVSNVIRIVADTAAGAVSTFVKGFGGLVNLLSGLFARFSHQLQNSTTVLGLRTSANCNTASVALKGIGDVCIWSGDALEEMTRGMGEALQASFGSLEAVTKSLNHLVILLLARDHPTPYISSPAPHSTANYTKEEYEEMMRQQNSLYSHHHEWTVNEPLEDDDVSTDSSGSRTSKNSNLNRLHAKKNKHGDKKFQKLKTAEELQEEQHSEPVEEPTMTSKLTEDWNRLWLLLTTHYAHALVYSTDFVSKYMSLVPTASMDVPSIGPYLLMALLVMCIINLIEYSSFVWRLLVLLLSISVLWFQLMSVEHSQRLRLVQRTSVKSIHSYLTRQTFMHSSNVTTTANSTVTALKRVSRGHNKHQATTSPLPYENAVWMNVLLSSLWNVNGPLGLREYVNGVYEEMVALEMAKISPGIADIRLKKFDLGSNSPMVKGIRMRSTRDKQCVAQVLKAAQWNQPHHSHNSEKNGENSEETSPNYVDAFLSFLAAKHSKSSVSTRDTSAAYYQRAKDPLSQRHSLSECDQVDLDLDFNFVSHDMDIVMSMRHEDSKSVLPEISVTLSELFLSGQLSFVMQITPDYPFLGNATVFFIEHPSLDFRVSSVGGVDLSAIPMGFEWMNVTLNWILSEYTAPFNTTLDLRHTLCPSCDKPAKLTTQELVMVQWTRFQSWLHLTSDQAIEWMSVGGEAVQGVLVKGQPMWKRVQLLTIKLLDGATVKSHLLLKRLSNAHRGVLKKIGFRLNDVTTLRLPEKSVDGREVTEVSGAADVAPNQGTVKLVANVGSGFDTRSGGERWDLIRMIKQEIHRLPRTAPEGDWWDDFMF